jgi:4-hydroxy-tetrahydrodipicolinate reductase
MTEPVSIIVNGAAGRMGQAVLRTIADRADMRVAAAIVRQGSELDGAALSRTLGERAPSLSYVSTWDARHSAAVMIDFTGAQAFDETLALALDRRIAFVSGSTGLSEHQHQALDAAAATIPVLWSANFSLGVAVLAHLAGRAARMLRDWDCEIVEAHHRRKLDAPSGTALMLGHAVSASRGVEPGPIHADRSGPRVSGDIGYAVIRGGDIVGEHDVLFIGEGERIELAHRATNRDIFARGAVAAACWIAGRPAARYAMTDILPLD